MKKILLLTFLAPLSSAQAYQGPDNLKGFKTVCVNAAFAEKGKANEGVAVKLINRLEAALKKAGISVVPGDCQNKGLSANKQINLFYSFFTTDNGQVFQAGLEGWLLKEGPYKEVTLWSSSFVGSMDEGGGSLEAADNADELVAQFIADWKKTTH